MNKKELIKKSCVLADYLTMRLIKSCSFDGITHSEFMMLRMIVSSEDFDEKLTVTLISEQIHISKAAVSQMITQLEGKNWIYKKQDENDKRQIYVCPTAEGRKAYERQLEIIGHSLQESFAELTVSDMERLCDVLETLASKVRKK